MFPSTVVAACAWVLIAAPAVAATGHGTAPAATIIGAEDPSAQIAVTVWLKQHNKAELDAAVHAMYDRNSPSYHHWLTVKDYQARYAPTAAEMAVVKQYLASHNLQVSYTDKLNHAVTVRGTVADVQRATGVQLNRALINGETHRIPSGTPVIPGSAGALVAAVQGLSDWTYKSHVARPINPETGKPFPDVALSKMVKHGVVDGAVQYYNNVCLNAPQSKLFTASGQVGSYSGSRYGSSISGKPPNLPPCGYAAPAVQAAYGLTPLYQQGLTGAGQTVVIVDAYGSDSIATDAATFNSINGLPSLSLLSNFNIYYPTGVTNCGGNTCGWDVETSLDVEWSHAMAPGANIALVLAADAGTSLDLSVLYAIDEELGNVISNSYGLEEAIYQAYEPSELTVENNINEIGAALGISVNFSSGDDGDFVAAYGEATVSMPASSPYATAVGGTSLFLNKGYSVNTQTGWGNNLTRIANYATSGDIGQPPIIPPLFEGFYAGAGGGASAVWPLPAFQSSLGGTARQVPDISMIADPFTGVEVIYTEGGEQLIGVIGGTSLASPTFAGIWALALQSADAPLGQAAALLYSLPAGAITDVTDVNGPKNVSGFTRLPKAAKVTYTPAELLAPVENTTNFIGALYNGTSTRWYAISFGTDSGLTTGPGWDNVTGLGTPNGASFVSAVTAAAPSKK
jgi:subtilase family serine protease